MYSGALSSLFDYISYIWYNKPVHLILGILIPGTIRNNVVSEAPLYLMRLCHSPYPCIKDIRKCPSVCMSVCLSVPNDLTNHWINLVLLSAKLLIASGKIYNYFRQGARRNHSLQKINSKLFKNLKWRINLPYPLDVLLCLIDHPGC